MKTISRLFVIALAATSAAMLLTAGAAEPPRPSLNVPCTKLASATSPARFFTTAIVARDAAFETIRATRQQPDDYAIRQTGGMTCEWSNGVGDGYFGDPAAWRGVRLELLPDGAAPFARFAAASGVTGTELLYCVTVFGVISCYYDGLVDGDWLSLHAQGVRSDSEGRTLMAKFRDAVRLGRPTGLPAWAPPVGTMPLPSTCDGLVAIGAVEAAFASRLPLEAFPGERIGSTPAHGARERIGSATCTWLGRGTWASAGTLATLPGGAWAWAESRSRFVPPSALTAVAIPRLRSGDEAWVRCDLPRQNCYLDLIIGGNWISMYANPEEGAGLVRADRRDALIFIATQIVAGLYP
ncbi:MAG: hypothetical protein ABI566_06465 [Pseudolysinimonas sp.]